MPPDLGAVRNPSTTGYALDLSATARNIVDLVYINTDKVRPSWPHVYRRALNVVV